jgi:hypothetical protein
MSSFRTQHPIAKAFDRSAMSVAPVAPAGEIAPSGLAGLSSIIPTTIHKDSAMRHSHTSRGLRTSAKTILAFVGLGFAGACADSISAPTSEVSFKVPAAFNVVLGSSSFGYDPARGVTQHFGDHVIVIPAGGICDPATSGYGSQFWDAACAPLTHSIIITATTYADADGHPYVDFQPALRFVPTKVTNLYLKDGKREGRDVSIIYCNALAVCADESINDASLQTQRVGKSRVVVRRIKHFSGYYVAAGNECLGTLIVDPDGGLWCELDGMSRSGYMLASGLGKSGGSDSLSRRRKSDH